MLHIIRLIKKTYSMADPQEGKLVLSNVASLSTLQAITYILPIIIIPYLFRVIGAEKFGLISFAHAFVLYFMILTDYGFSISATKEVSLFQSDKDKIHEIFASVMTIKVLLALVSTVVLTGLVSTVPRFQEDPLVYYLSFGIVLGNTLFPAWYFMGTEKMKFIASLNIAAEVLYAVLIFIYVHSPEDYLLIPLISSVVFIANGLLGQYIVIKDCGVRPRLPTLSELKHQLSAGWNIFVSILAINAYTATRIFAVGLMTNNVTTGLYSIAEKIATIMQTFPLYSFSQALFPRLSKIFHKNPLKAYQLMQHIQLITIHIAVICLPILFLASPAIVRIAFGGDYTETVTALRLLLISIFFISANAFRVQFLLVSGHTRTYSKIHVIMAILGVPLIIGLINVFSYAGAALATIGIEAGIFLLTFFAVKKLHYR